MKLFNRYNIERNFPRGVFLEPLGKIPPFEIRPLTGYKGELFVPIASEEKECYDILKQDGSVVMANDLLLEKPVSVFSPCGGTIHSLERVYVNYLGLCRAFCIKPDREFESHSYGRHGNISFNPYETDSSYILGMLDNAGIFCNDGRLLVDVLRGLSASKIDVVVANASPPEPDINTPAAILNTFPEKVYAGLAILRHLLAAKRTLLAYPCDIEIDTDFADMWQVQTVEVSEKYPQYHSVTLSKTLHRRKIIQKTEKCAVFDIQTLALVERAVFAHLPLTERIVTIAGDAVEDPGHYIVPVGLPVSDLLSFAGVEYYDAVISGRSLTGTLIEPGRTVVGPFCESFTVLKNIPHRTSNCCNRCGRCIEFCPVKLDPIGLNDLIEKRDFETAVSYGLFDCIECGLCSYCCCSGLKIMDNIRMAKRTVKSRS